MRSKTQSSGVRRASRPTFANVCMMYFLSIPAQYRYRRRARCRCPFDNSCVPRRCWPPQSAHLSEALAQFGDEELGLLKRGKVAAFRNLVPVEKVRIGLI